MTVRNVTPIRAAKDTKAPAERPLPSRVVIEGRTRDASGELGRVMTMLHMLSLIAHSEILESEHVAEISGMGETIDLAIQILEDVQNDIDPMTLLAPEASA